MAGQLSEYAYGKIKIRVMKVNRERCVPSPHVHVAKLSTIFCLQRLVWSAQHPSTSGASNIIRQTSTNCGAERGHRELIMWFEQTPLLLPILDGYCTHAWWIIFDVILSITTDSFDHHARSMGCAGCIAVWDVWVQSIYMCVCVTVCGVGAEGILMPGCMLNLCAPFFSWFLSACVLLSRGNSSCFWSFLCSSLFPSLVCLSVRLRICLQFWPPWRARVDCEGKTIQAYTPKYRHCGLNTRECFHLESELEHFFLDGNPDRTHKDSTFVPEIVFKWHEPGCCVRWSEWRPRSRSAAHRRKQRQLQKAASYDCTQHVPGSRLFQGYFCTQIESSCVPFGFSFGFHSREDHATSQRNSWREFTMQFVDHCLKCVVSMAKEPYFGRAL